MFTFSGSFVHFIIQFQVFYVILIKSKEKQHWTIFSNWILFRTVQFNSNVFYWTLAQNNIHLTVQYEITKHNLNCSLLHSLQHSIQEDCIQSYWLHLNLLKVNIFEYSAKWFDTYGRNWWIHWNWEECWPNVVNRPRVSHTCTIGIRAIWKWWESPTDLMDIIWICLEDAFGISEYRLLYFEKIRTNIHFLCAIKYFRLIVEKTSKDFTAKVQHYTGRTILECNTNEWSLAKQLYRPYDMAAYINFGRVCTLFSSIICDFHSLQAISIRWFPIYSRYLHRDALKRVSLKWKILLKPHQAVNWIHFSKSSKRMDLNWKNRHSTRRADPVI